LCALRICWSETALARPTAADETNHTRLGFIGGGMVWLVRSTSLDPKLQPDFNWMDPPPKYYEDWHKAVPRDPNSIPRIARRKGRRKSPPPCFFMLDGPMVVCAAFRDIVEALEPNTHEFHPITLLGKDGSELPDRFYILNILVKLDALVIEKSDVHWSSWQEYKKADGSLIRFRVLLLDPYPKRLFAKKDIVGGHHLWRGDQHLFTLIYMSDALMSAVHQAGLRGLEAYPMVDE
jgi:hypothetical protein